VAEGAKAKEAAREARAKAAKETKKAKAKAAKEAKLAKASRADQTKVEKPPTPRHRHCHLRPCLFQVIKLGKSKKSSIKTKLSRAPQTQSPRTRS
jgi:hypothetical protein